MMGYNPYPYPGEVPKRKGPGKIIFIGIVVIALIAIIAVAASMSSGGGNKTGTTQQPSTTESNKTAKDVEERDDNKLDLSVKTNLSKALKAQTIKANIREQINLSSGFSFMVTKIENYTPASSSIKPAENKKFVVVTAVTGNRLESGNLSVSYLDFRLRDESNTAIAAHGATTNEILNNTLSSPSELKPGEQITGKVVFEVDATDTNWIFVHSETYQKTTDNTTFTVEGTIVLTLPLTSNTVTPTPATPTPSST
jgi:hypothetical protein